MIRKSLLLDEGMVREIAVLSQKEDRDFSSSLRHALRIGLLALQNPELTAAEIKDILEARAEKAAGLVEAVALEDF